MKIKYATISEKGQRHKYVDSEILKARLLDDNYSAVLVIAE